MGCDAREQWGAGGTGRDVALRDGEGALKAQNAP
jgi:hypothetical protein